MGIKKISAYQVDFPLVGGRYSCANGKFVETLARKIRDLCVSLGIPMTIKDSWGRDFTTRFFVVKHRFLSPCLLIILISSLWRQKNAANLT